MDRDAGEISELAQNRLAIGVGYSANACGGDAVTTGAARCAARSTVSAVVIRRDQSLSITCVLIHEKYEKYREDIGLFGI